MMNDNKSGLMSMTSPKKTTVIMDEMRRNLAPQSAPKASLEEPMLAVDPQ